MNSNLAYGLFAALILTIGGLTALAVLRSRNVDVWPWNGEAKKFEGVYTVGFETSEFVPCRQTGEKERYWLVPEAGLQLDDLLARMGAGRGFASAHVTLEGKLETRPGGGYGHLGAYDGQLVARRVVSVEPGRGCE